MNRRLLWPAPVAVALALLTTLASPGFAQEETQRTWVDSTGQHRTAATLVKVDGDNVELKTTDGRTITVDINRLSQADRDYLATRSQPGDDAKASSGTRRRTLPPAKMPEVAELTSFAEIQTDDATEVRMPRTADWNLTPDARASDTPPLTNNSIEIGEDEVLGMGLGGAAAAPDGKHAVVSYSVDMAENFGSRELDRLALLDLTTGEVLGTAALRMIGNSVHDVTPDGQRMLGGSSSRGRFTGQPAIYEIRNGNVRQRLNFDPHKQGGFPNFARFAGDERLVTHNDAGTIAVWDFDYAKLLWWLDTEDGGIAPGMSANGKYLIGWANGDLFVVDLMQGAVVAKQTAELNGIKALAISPDGTKFAGAGHNLVRVWDFATGELLDEMHVGSLSVDVSLDWIDNEFLVAQSMSYCEVIDTRLGIPVWNFSNGIRASYFADHQGRLWSWDTDVSQTMKPMSVPPPEIADRYRDRAPEDLIVLRAGDSVKVECFFQDYDRRVREEIEATVKQQLQESGYNVTSRAENTIRVWAGAGERFTDEDGRKGWKSDLKMPGFRFQGGHFFMIALYDENEELVWKGGSAEQPEDEPVQGRYFAHLYIPTTIRQSPDMTPTPAALPEAWNNPGSSRMGGGRAFGQRRGGFGGSRRPDRKK